MYVLKTPCMCNYVIKVIIENKSNCVVTMIKSLLN